MQESLSLGSQVRHFEMKSIKVELLHYFNKLGIDFEESLLGFYGEGKHEYPPGDAALAADPLKEVSSLLKYLVRRQHF